MSLERGEMNVLKSSQLDQLLRPNMRLEHSTMFSRCCDHRTRDNILVRFQEKSVFAFQNENTQQTATLVNSGHHCSCNWLVLAVWLLYHVTRKNYAMRCEKLQNLVKRYIFLQIPVKHGQHLHFCLLQLLLSLCYSRLFSSE
jgi:hypothetical protein